MSIDQSRVQTWLVTFLKRRLLVKIGNLEIWVGTKQELGILALFLVELGISLHGDNYLEFASGHALELTFKLIRVATEHLHHLGILNSVEQLDRTTVVHKTRDCSIKSLRS